MDRNNILLRKALEYARMGLLVFPVREAYEGEYFSPKSGELLRALPKKPRTGRGFKDATTNPDQIMEWWTQRWKNSAIGIATGESKLFVIDIDKHTEDVNGIKNYKSLRINDRGTWITRTNGGGWHIIFSDSKGLGKTKSNESIGIDTRGRGGYIIAPPSYIVSEDGAKRFYTVLQGWNSERPVEVTEEILESLGISARDSKEHIHSVMSEEEILENYPKAIRAIKRLPYSFLEDYSKWVAVGMALREFGEDGFNLWEKWTQQKYFAVNPKSKRQGQLRYKWESFMRDGISGYSLGSLIYWSNGGSF